VTIAVSRVPTFPGLDALVARNRPGGLDTNAEYFGGGIRAADGAAQAGPSVPDRWWVLFDPQTSGGLLIAAAADAAEAVEAALSGEGVEAARIGRVLPPISGVQILAGP
jgi:selenide, water dikinase